MENKINTLNDEVIETNENPIEIEDSNTGVGVAGLVILTLAVGAGLYLGGKKLISKIRNRRKLNAIRSEEETESNED